MVMLGEAGGMLHQNQTRCSEIASESIICTQMPLAWTGVISPFAMTHVSRHEAFQSL